MTFVQAIGYLLAGKQLKCKDGTVRIYKIDMTTGILMVLQSYSEDEWEVSIGVSQNLLCNCEVL